MCACSDLAVTGLRVDSSERRKKLKVPSALHDPSETLCSIYHMRTILGYGVWPQFCGSAWSICLIVVIAYGIPNSNFMAHLLLKVRGNQDSRTPCTSRMVMRSYEVVFRQGRLHDKAPSAPSSNGRAPKTT